MSEEQAGQLIDSLGLVVELEDGDMPVDALLFLKVVKADGSVSLVKGRSEALDWISVLGMLTAALEIENNGYAQVDTEGG
jgi:hypothetical protein